MPEKMTNLKGKFIEVDGMRRPVDTLSNTQDKLWWETVGGAKVLRYFQDLVIDAIVNITSLNGEYTENSHLFLTFLKEIKFKGVYDFSSYCHGLAVTMTYCATESSKWRERVYENTLFRELAIELAESLVDVRKIYKDRRDK